MTSNFQLRNRLVTAFSLVSLSLVVGCTQEPPGCSSSQTLKIIEGIVWKKIDKKAFPLAVENDVSSMLSMSYPAPSDYNEKIKKYSCTGVLKLITKAIEEPREENSDAWVLYNQTVDEIDDVTNRQINKACGSGACSLQVSYATQLVDGEQLVTLTGLEDWVPLLAGLQSSLNSHSKKTVWQAKNWPADEQKGLVGRLNSYWVQAKADFNKGYAETSKPSK